MPSSQEFEETTNKQYMQEVGGGFYCQTCELYTGDAMLNQRTGEITWECETGHKSSMNIFGNKDE